MAARIASSTGTTTAAVLPEPVEDFVLQLTLERLGLPSNPSVIAHIKALVAGTLGELPSRGLLVTTYGYMLPSFVTAGDEVPADAKHDRAMFHELYPADTGAGSDFELNGSLEWITGPLLARANQVVQEHRDWTRQMVQHPLTAPSVARAAQATAFQQESHAASWFDYEAEALAGVDDLIKEARQPHVNREAKITNYLDRIGERVSRRRKREGLIATPPSGWRNQIRDQLGTILRDRLR
jgi:hypothetical protein